MTERGPAVPHSSRLRRWAGRVLLLAVTGTGLWLVGSASSAASAEEPTLPVPVTQVVPGVQDPTAIPAGTVVDQVVEPLVDGLLPLVLQQVQELSPPALPAAVAAIVPRMAEPVASAPTVPAPVLESAAPTTLPTAIPQPMPDRATTQPQTQPTGWTPTSAAPPVEVHPADIPPAALVGLPQHDGSRPHTDAMPAAAAPGGRAAADQTPADLAADCHSEVSCAVRPRPSDGRSPAVGSASDPSFSPD